MSDSSTNDDVAAGGVVIPLAIICVALRFYTRHITKAGYGWDDWLILCSVVVMIVAAALLLWATAVDPNGAKVSQNQDPDFVYTPEDHLYLELSFLPSILYFTIVGSTKLSILLMYNRIFSAHDAFRILLVVVCALVIGFWVGCTVATLTNCIPLYQAWRTSAPNPDYCFNFNTFWVAAGACEVLLDVIILALPIRVVSEMQMSWQRKLSVAGIFLLGAFVVVTGLVKVVLGYVAGSWVPSYGQTEVWSVVHIGVGVVCACLPVFMPLIKRVSGSRLFARLSRASLSERIKSVNWSPMSRRSPAARRKRSSVSALFDLGTLGTAHEGETEQVEPIAPKAEVVDEIDEIRSGSSQSFAAEKRSEEPTPSRSILPTLRFSHTPLFESRNSWTGSLFLR